MNKVCVLLSTYNGEKYLSEQLDSVLSQTGVDVYLIIRDDGSSDKTVSIIKEYQNKYSHITLLEENNCGVERSFEKLYLFSSVHSDCDFFAFCDQDDVWFPEKLENSINALQNEQGPALYCCNQMITDSNLHPLRLMIEKGQVEKWRKEFETNYLINRHGCTMVWNRSLNKILSQIKHDPVCVPGHDAWLSLVAQCCGKVILGDEPLQYYRVHASNSSGLATNNFKRLQKGIRFWWMKDSHRNRLARNCIDYFGINNFNKPALQYLKKLACYRDSWSNTIKLAIAGQIWRHGPFDGLFWAISILLRKY